MRYTLTPAQVLASAVFGATASVRHLVCLGKQYLRACLLTNWWRPVQGNFGPNCQQFLCTIFFPDAPSANELDLNALPNDDGSTPGLFLRSVGTAVCPPDRSAFQ